MNHQPILEDVEKHLLHGPQAEVQHRLFHRHPTPRGVDGRVHLRTSNLFCSQQDDDADGNHEGHEPQTAGAFPVFGPGVVLLRYIVKSICFFMVNFFLFLCCCCGVTVSNVSIDVPVTHRVCRLKRTFIQEKMIIICLFFMN